MIIEHVWDQSFEGLTNIVDVYVRHLRAKVDDPFPAKLLRTVRGVGYSLTRRGADMNTRSIRFRLVMWYAGLLTGIFLLLCALLYLNLRHFLENDLRESQARRARQIAQTLLAHVGQTGEAYVASQVKDWYRAGNQRPFHPHHPGRWRRWFTFPARRRTEVSIPGRCRC